MQIDELSQGQLDLMVQVVAINPLFSVATIPEGHKHYEAKAEVYAEVVRDVQYLASLGFVEEVNDMEGEHNIIKEAAEKLSGYKYDVYQITKLGVSIFQGYVNDLTKELNYRNSVN